MPIDESRSHPEITGLLNRLVSGSEEERRRLFDQLMPVIYGELKALARAHRYRWQGDLAPGTTSLVHEAYVRLAKQPGADFENRRQFYSLASKVVRSILVDNARKQQRQKRGGRMTPVTLQENLVSVARCDELLSLDDALSRLDERRPDLARVVEHLCFGGLTFAEAADTLEISPSTVKRRWRLARAWLYRSMQPAATKGPGMR